MAYTKSAGRKQREAAKLETLNDVQSPADDVLRFKKTVTGVKTISAGGIEILPGVGFSRGNKSPMPVFGDTFAIGNVNVVSGAPTISAVTGPNGKLALKIVTGVGVNAEVSFPSLVGNLFSGETDISVSGGWAEGVGGVSLYATPDADYSVNFCVGLFIPGAAPINSAGEQGGTYTAHLGKSTLSTTGTIAYPFAINAHKLRITPRGGMSATVYIYGIGFNPQPAAGRVSVICDDGYDSWFGLGQPLFDARNIPVTCAAIPQVIDTGAGYAYLRQLKGLVNRGGAVVAHGPNTGGGAGNLLTAFPDTVSRVADMSAVRAWIAQQGLATPGYDQCYVWPQGTFQSALGDLALLDAALAAGFTTGRNANGISVGLYSNFDALSKYQHLCCPIVGHAWAGTTAAEATNITAITTAINNAAAQGADITLMFHRVQPTATVDGSMNSIGIRVSDLTTIADAIAAKVTAGTLKAVTLPQLAVSAQGNFWQGL